MKQVGNQKRPNEESEIEKEPKMIKSTHVPTSNGSTLIGLEFNSTGPPTLPTNVQTVGANLSRQTILKPVCKPIVTPGIQSVSFSSLTSSTGTQNSASSQVFKIAQNPSRIPQTSSSLNSNISVAQQNNTSRKLIRSGTSYNFIDSMASIANTTIQKQCSTNNRNETGSSSLDKMTIKFFEDQMTLLKSNNDVLISGNDSICILLQL